MLDYKLKHNNIIMSPQLVIDIKLTLDEHKRPAIVKAARD